ncbi:hypothetical protein PCANC_21033 [Puccinia coronata f. sp. avenae]|uniref:HAT C-terminal dimerisation domain-containing protein n=1 Tax=Puccinia coronata f. sp. avenae TaxID=200324 RepID=A0A2N5TWG1_9BASI|nr:hypothetical protein PCANC_21033 [Puccinia coronata f. sp. avenae]
MHIFCVCHKLALIVNAGLKALLLQTLPPGKAKESVLGFFPVLGRLAKEDEPEQSEQPALENKKESPLTKDDATWESDYGNADASISDVGNETSKDTESNNDAGPTKEKSNPKTPATSSKHAKSTKLLDLTQKLDGVIKQITCSAAQRSNFDQTAKELNVKVAPLIAGYKIDNLNAELEVFVNLTSQMEVFGSASSEVTESLQLLKRKFKQTKDQKKELAKNKKSDNLDGEITIVPKPLNPLPGGSSLMSRLALHVELQSEPTTQSDEIGAYLKAKIQFKQGAMHDKTTPLTWWRENRATYQTLAVMARAYLGTPGSSCAVERLFSAAADVCSSSRGRLQPSTMSHSVSSLMWLREDVPLSGDFAEAGNALNALLPKPKK